MQSPPSLSLFSFSRNFSPLNTCYKQSWQSLKAYSNGILSCRPSSVAVKYQMSQLKRWCLTSMSLTPSRKGRKVSSCLGSSQSRERLKENCPSSLQSQQCQLKVRCIYRWLGKLAEGLMWIGIFHREVYCCGGVCDVFVLLVEGIMIIGCGERARFLIMMW